MIDPTKSYPVTVKLPGWLLVAVNIIKNKANMTQSEIIISMIIQAVKPLLHTLPEGIKKHF